MRDMDPRVAALLIGLGIALIAIFNFSRSIGADFQVTLGAVGYSVVVALVAGALCWTPLKPSLPDHILKDKLRHRAPADVPVTDEKYTLHIALNQLPC